VEKKELVKPERKAIIVEAFDEQSAMSKARTKAALRHNYFGNTLTIKSVKLAIAGSKGFLGIGKKPNQYEVVLLQQAVVEVTYKTKAKIRVEVGAGLETQLVEDIVENLRKRPPSKEIYYIVLFGDRPLTAKMQGEIILCFTRKSKAEEFMTKYQDIYYCTEPLSVLALGQVSELWAMLNNKAKDTLYQSPYGLIINFNYVGQPYHKYSKDDLRFIGLDGLQKSLGALPR
jgi:hypothetical protein